MQICSLDCNSDSSNEMMKKYQPAMKEKAKELFLAGEDPVAQQLIGDYRSGKLKSSYEPKRVWSPNS